MKAGFVNIFGKPNAGKSTLMNALMGEKLAIVTPKVQTTRHRIKGILTTDDYQIIFSDTPGIITPKYKLHEKMMNAVKGSLEDADVVLYLVDIGEDWEEAHEIFSSLKTRAPAILVINKIDRVGKEKVQIATDFFREKSYQNVIPISAEEKAGLDELLKLILSFLPEGEPFYQDDNLSDLPMRFFVSELIREKLFLLYQQELPYQATVLVQEFSQKSTLTKIRAEIIVQRETQKGIILGHGGKMIRKLGTLSRVAIEDFIEQKVFLELFVKVRPKWRDNELYLKEYGY